MRDEKKSLFLPDYMLSGINNLRICFAYHKKSFNNIFFSEGKHIKGSATHNAVSRITQQLAS